MSKSVGKGALWINDTSQEIREKYRQAYCPQKVVTGNPVMDHAHMLVFPHHHQLDIQRSSKYGGNITYYSFEELARAYGKGDLHPLDLKNSVSAAVTKLIQPVSDYFENKPENLQAMRRLQVTR
jgi:tyrosyl-tRNA synthetase